MKVTQVEAPRLTVRAATTQDRISIENFTASLQEFERGIRPSRRPGAEVKRESVETMFQRVASQGGAIFLAETEGGAVGFLACYVGEDELEGTRAELVMSDVWVAPQTRNRGVFKALVSAALVHARELGLTRLTASAVSGNDGACAAYESLGFRRSFVTFEFDAEGQSWQLAGAPRGGMRP